MKHVIICTILYLLNPAPPVVETLYFDVILRNKVVGELKATRQLQGNKTIYKNTTTLSTHIITDIVVSYQYEVAFANDQLIHADAFVTTNNKMHKQMKTNWTGSQYHIVNHKNKERWLDDPIPYSVIMLLFKEPIGLTNCYAELSGELHQLVPKGNHTYQKIDGRKNVNTYHYQNGQLVALDADAGLFKFKIKRRYSK